MDQTVTLSDHGCRLRLKVWPHLDNGGKVWSLSPSDGKAVTAGVSSMGPPQAHGTRERFS